MKLKRYLFVAAVLLVSIVTFAIAKFNRQHSAAAPVKVEVEVADTEIGTNDDPWSEMENLVNAYYNSQGIFYKGKIRLLDENGDQEKVLEEMPFHFTLFEDDYHYQMGSFEMVSKNGFLLAVDHISKNISIARQPDTKPQLQLFNPHEFKKLLEEKKAIVKVSVDKGYKIITVDDVEDPAIQGYRIYYTPHNYKIHKIEIGMVRLAPLEENEVATNNETNSEENEGQINTFTYFLEVTYEEITTLSLKKSEFNPEEKFITVKENTIQLMPAFSQYELQSASDQ